jgi:hypothetical protein
MENNQIIIASRSYKWKGNDIKVNFFRPVKKEDGHYYCNLSFDGLAIETQIVPGLDSLEAIMNSLRCAKKTLSKHAQDITFLEGAKGDLGIPNFILDYLGVDFHDEMVELINKKAEQRMNLSSKD